MSYSENPSQLKLVVLIWILPLIAIGIISPDTARADCSDDELIAKVNCARDVRPGPGVAQAQVAAAQSLAYAGDEEHPSGAPPIDRSDLSPHVQLFPRPADGYDPKKEKNGEIHCRLLPPEYFPRDGQDSRNRPILKRNLEYELINDRCYLTSKYSAEDLLTKGGPPVPSQEYTGREAYQVFVTKVLRIGDKGATIGEKERVVVQTSFDRMESTRVEKDCDDPWNQGWVRAVTTSSWVVGEIQWCPGSTEVQTLRDYLCKIGCEPLRKMNVDFSELALDVKFRWVRDKDIHGSLPRVDGVFDICTGRNNQWIETGRDRLARNPACP